jgi:hypothetical protein
MPLCLYDRVKNDSRLKRRGLKGSSVAGEKRRSKFVINVQEKLCVWRSSKIAMLCFVHDFGLPYSLIIQYTIN